MHKKIAIDNIKLFDVPQAAAFLGVSSGTIHRWAHQGVLRGMKVGIRGDWRFSQEQLLRMINASNLGQGKTSVSSKGGMQTSFSKLAPVSIWRTMKSAGHFVHFYEKDSYLIELLASYMEGGLSKEDSCVIVATESHRQAIEKRLQEDGFDIAALRAEGRYIDLDASETLSKFMIGGILQPKLFRKVIGGVIAEAAARGRHVRVFGEMVALLWQDGNEMGAFQLEKFWNELAKIHVFSLFCAYPMHSFGHESHGEKFSQVHKSHKGGVIPTEAYLKLKTSDERFRVIAELQQKAQALESEIEKRKKLERQRDDFIGIASHELKTPVTSMKIFAQVLRDRFLREGDEGAAEVLKKMDKKIDKLSGLITDLLDVSKIKVGRMQFNHDLFDINDLLHEVVDEVQLTTTRHMLVKEFAPSRKVVGDRERLGQVIANLLDNAIKYSPDAKEIIVRTKIQGGNVIVSIQDFGVGIKKKDQDKIFSRFYRVQSDIDKTYPGMGLGLYISSQIINHHKGKIWVESKKGKGTIFFFSLMSSKN